MLNFTYIHLSIYFHYIHLYSPNENAASYHTRKNTRSGPTSDNLNVNGRTMENLELPCGIAKFTMVSPWGEYINIG
jgi:hypothetical protein